MTYENNFCIRTGRFHEAPLQITAPPCDDEHPSKKQLGKVERLQSGSQSYPSSVRNRVSEPVVQVVERYPCELSEETAYH